MTEMLRAVAAPELNGSAQRAVRYKEWRRDSGNIPTVQRRACASGDPKHELQTRLGEMATCARWFEAIAERDERLSDDAARHGLPAAFRIRAVLLLRRHYELE